MESQTAVIGYEAPTAELGATRLAMGQAIYWFIVTVLALLIIGGLALFCISKGMDLHAGWDNGNGTFSIACEVH